MLRIVKKVQPIYDGDFKSSEKIKIEKYLKELYSKLKMKNLVISKIKTLVMVKISERELTNFYISEIS